MFTRAASYSKTTPLTCSIRVRPQSIGIGKSRVLLLPRPPHDRSYHTSRTGSALSGLRSRYLDTVNKSRGLGPALLNPTSRTTSSTQFSAKRNTRTRLFSSTPHTMVATKIDGTAIAKKIREKLHKEIEATQKINPRYRPSLKIIQGKIKKISTVPIADI